MRCNVAAVTNRIWRIAALITVAGAVIATLSAQTAPVPVRASSDTLVKADTGSSPPDATAIGIVVEGIVISRATGEPPAGDSIVVKIDSIVTPVSSSGEFSRIVEPRPFYIVDVLSKNHAPVRRTIAFTPGKTNYFLTIMLDRKAVEATEAAETAAPPAVPPSADSTAVPWTISGTIVDSRFDLAIESDSITLLFDGDTVRASDKGNFVASTRVPGAHTFFASIPGYQQVTETVTLSSNDKQPFVTIPTTVIGRTITRREITVSAAGLPVHRSASVAKIEMSRKELQRATATMNDPVQALQTLPGVATESDITARPVIRGGDVLESRIFLDGVTLIQPYHFGGVRSTLNQMGLKGLTLYKSGFPAEFHNAQSGIIDAAGRIPSDEKTAFEADLYPRTHWNVNVSYYLDHAFAASTSALVVQVHLYM